MCTFYILQSPLRDIYYLGHTCEVLSERLRKHNSDHKGFTGGTGDWAVVYSEVYECKEEARKREKEVKACKSRKRVEQLVRASRP